MNNLIFRKALVDDIPFLVQTIIEAEKSGTDKFSYSTIFGLSENEARSYLIDMMLEEVDGCELSLSTFLLALDGETIVGSLSSWIEGQDGIPSSVIKGNLINFILPKECIEHAMPLNEILKEMNIEFIPNTIILGAGYVSPDYRGMGLLPVLINKQIDILRGYNSTVKEVYAQIFSCNKPSIRSVEKLGFEQVLLKESSNKEVIKYLPSNSKVLVRKELIK